MWGAKAGRGLQSELQPSARGRGRSGSCWAWEQRARNRPLIETGRSYWIGACPSMEDRNWESKSPNRAKTRTGSSLTILR